MNLEEKQESKKKKQIKGAIYVRKFSLKHEKPSKMHICYVAGIFSYLDFVHTYTFIFKTLFSAISKSLVFSDLKLRVRVHRSSLKLAR